VVLLAGHVVACQHARFGDPQWAIGAFVPLPPLIFRQVRNEVDDARSVGAADVPSIVSRADRSLASGASDCVTIWASNALAVPGAVDVYVEEA
jgi:hypothetical protein